MPMVIGSRRFCCGTCRSAVMIFTFLVTGRSFILFRFRMYLLTGRGKAILPTQADCGGQIRNGLLQLLILLE